MNKKAFRFLVLIMVIISGCRKDEVPQKSFYFSFRVNISNKITEPTIVNGYYGTLTDKNGKVKLKKNAIEENITTVAQNCIYLFGVDKKEAIEEVSFEKNGKIVYDLKQLKKADIKPKFIIIPNKSGFFQFDSGDQPYLPLIEVKGNLGYYPTPLAPLPAQTGALLKLDIALDF